MNNFEQTSQRSQMHICLYVIESWNCSHIITTQIYLLTTVDKRQSLELCGTYNIMSRFWFIIKIFFLSFYFS